jgi:hypothetical protein
MHTYIHIYMCTYTSHRHKTAERQGYTYLHVCIHESQTQNGKELASYIHKYTTHVHSCIKEVRVLVYIHSYVHTYTHTYMATYIHTLSHRHIHLTTRK